MLNLKEFKKELSDVFSDELYYIDDYNDLRRFSREQSDLYIEKIDRLELFDVLSDIYNIEEFENLEYSNNLADVIDSFNYMFLSDFIFNHLKELYTPKNYLK